jgi:hypothetical protein
LSHAPRVQLAGRKKPPIVGCGRTLTAPLPAGHQAVSAILQIFWKKKKKTLLPASCPWRPSLWIQPLREVCRYVWINLRTNFPQGVLLSHAPRVQLAGRKKPPIVGCGRTLTAPLPAGHQTVSAILQIFWKKKKKTLLPARNTLESHVLSTTCGKKKLPIVELRWPKKY